MNAKETGALIASRRRELGLSQTALAQQIHVTDKAVSRWETGRGLPDIQSLEPLAAALNLSVSELLSGRRLTEEEQTVTAGSQIVAALRRQKRRLWQGAAAVFLFFGLLLGTWAAVHWWTTVPLESDALLDQAVEYLLSRPVQMPVVDPEQGITGVQEKLPDFQRETLRIAKMEQRGTYLAALLTDDAGYWGLCVFDRDPLFADRWRANGGKVSFRPGILGSWNYGSPQGEAVIIVCGGDLPEEAAWYTFQNAGITYQCLIQEGQVLNLFVVPDQSDIHTHSLDLLDQAMRSLDTEEFVEGSVQTAP